MSTVAQPCPSWTRGSVPVSRRIQRRRFNGRTNLTRLNPQRRRQVLAAAVVEAATPSSSSNSPSPGDGSNQQVLTLQVDRANELQAESRALGRATDVTLYTPQLLATKYGSKPFKVFPLNPFWSPFLEYPSWVGLSFFMD